MTKKTRFVRAGFTMVEMEVGILVASVLTIVLGIVLVDTQKAWSSTYTRSKEAIGIDGHVAKLTFDSLIRKASSKQVTVDSLGDWIEVSYYADPSSTELDRYCHLYVSAGALMAEHGQLESGSKTALQTSTVCDNVSQCLFTQNGRSAQMVLTLTEASRQNTIISSAYMHNK